MEKLQHFRHTILFGFNRGAKAAEAARNISPCLGTNAIGESTARKWFSPLKEDRFDISYYPRSGRPSGCDEDRLSTLIHNDPDCHPRGPGLDSRLYPRNFSGSIGSGTGSTQPCEDNWVAT